MLTQIILTTAAFAISTGLKTCQSRTIALKNYKAVPIVSYLIAVLELTVYTTAISTFLTTSSIWPVLFLAGGASVGALAGCYVADLISNKKAAS